MKITYIKRFHFIFVILLFSFFSFSCDNILQPPKNGKSGDGNGYVSLSISGLQVGRTILPLKENNEFAGYKLEFTSENQGDPVIEYWGKDQTSGLISLSAGTHYLTVTAFIDDSYEMPAARISRDVEVIAGKKAVISLALEAIIEGGEGTFSWNIKYPDDVTKAGMTITPLSENATDEQILYFKGGEANTSQNSSMPLSAGYYRVIIKLSRSEETAELREILHIYQNMESVFEYDFTENHFTRAIFVTNGNDVGVGSLRWAIDQAISGQNSTIIVDSGVGKIVLSDQLDISTNFVITEINFTIEGNGVIITKSLDLSNSLFKFSGRGNDIYVTIRRVHFTEGQAESGGAIYNNDANITLESCIFSGNKVTQNGGAIYNSNGTLEIKGCTFYGNNATSQGGAIYFVNGNMSFEGNLFYGNTAAGYPVINLTDSGTMISGGYNVVDIESGGNNNWGWIPRDNDIYVPTPTVMQKTFKLLPNSGAAQIIPVLPSDYPTADFYGYPITTSAAAGAVQQDTATESYNIVTFNTGDEEIKISPVAVRYGDTLVKPGDPDKYGYSFGGWYKENGSSWNFDTDTVSAPTTLSAKWGYTVVFNANEGLGTMPNQFFTETKQNLAVNRFTRYSYTFSGWITEGAIVYKDEQSISINDLPQNPNGTINLSAKWVLNDNIIDVDNTGAWMSACDKIKVTELASPDREFIINVTSNLSVDGITDPSGYTFGPITGITVTIKGNFSLTLNDDKKGTLLGIITGQKVIIEDIDLIGHNSNSTSLVWINGGEFIMQGSASITGNNNTDGNGGGVYIERGIFTMTGGEILGNKAEFHGGGVCVSHNEGTFRMTGGTIYGKNEGENSNTDKSDEKGDALYDTLDKAPFPQYGIFDQYGEFIPKGSLQNTDDTIKVINGELITSP